MSLAEAFTVRPPFFPAVPHGTLPDAADGKLAALRLQRDDARAMLAAAETKRRAAAEAVQHAQTGLSHIALFRGPPSYLPRAAPPGSQATQVSESDDRPLRFAKGALTRAKEEYRRAAEAADARANRASTLNALVANLEGWLGKLPEDALLNMHGGVPPPSGKASALATQSNASVGRSRGCRPICTGSEARLGRARSPRRKRPSRFVSSPSAPSQTSLR